MKILKVIESKRWENKIDGRTVSIYGAVPYSNSTDMQHWHIVSVGWTWLTSDGTVGLGRQPAKTYDEALEVMKKVNSLN